MSDNETRRDPKTVAILKEADRRKPLHGCNFYKLAKMSVCYKWEMLNQDPWTVRMDPE